MSRILIIDDDSELCELLTRYLSAEGFDVETIYESQAGLEKALSDEYDLLILDVMLPEFNGFELLRQLRAHSNLAVLMLTARGDEVDRIVGLEMGADDYLPKPFNPRELVARIRAINRRMLTPASPASFDSNLSLTRGDITLDPKTQIVTQNGKEISVTGAEFALLHELLKKSGTVVSRDELTEKALGRKPSLFDRSIDVHIASLRKKLGHEINGNVRIKSVRGIGYMYVGL